MFDTVLKTAGFAVNCALLLVFAITALYLTSYGMSYLSAAGGIPGTSSLGWAVKNPISVLNNIILAVTNGTLSSTTFNYIAAWATLIAAAGAWWMTALGVRWLYYAALRAIHHLNP